jgi:D-arabinose 1-dehydrogenase-like Zn-dependent alcohol dehydrogenase
MAASMRAARLHEPGRPLRIDMVEIPEPRPRDVLVQVKACGIIPNMNAIFSGRLWNHLPPLPASVGLDAAGIIAKVGSHVTDVAVGDRVYVNPWLSCGTCPYCRAGEPMLCNAAAFQGYFGFFPHSVRQLTDYPFGGFSEYLTASPQRLVHLPQQVTFDQAARFGYLGTSFAALRLGEVSGGSWIAINGITGTLGAGATLLALGMGATRILGLGRNREVLEQLKALAPDRIEILALGDAPIADWIREHTEQLGVDVVIDCSARSAAAANTAEAVAALKRGGAAINIGALTETLAIQPIRFMTARLQFRGSNWFTTGEGQLMAEMARVGALDLTKLVTRAYPLAKVNDALADVQKRPGGLVNIVVHPDD